MIATTRKEDVPKMTSMDEILSNLSSTTGISFCTSSAPTMATSASKRATSNSKDNGTFSFQPTPPSPDLPPAPESLPKPPKPMQRKRAQPFKIFVDADADAYIHPAKKTDVPRKDGRTPLGVKSDFANSSPSASPRDPRTPFGYSTTDPFWFNRENHAPFTAPPSPPIPPPLRRQSCAVRPRNMELYDLLEVSSWKAGRQEIKAAYRRMALKYHPDKVPVEERNAANAKMQKINAAKEILLNVAARKKYDRDGKLPWEA